MAISSFQNKVNYAKCNKNTDKGAQWRIFLIKSFFVYFNLLCLLCLTYNKIALMFPLNFKNKNSQSRK